MTIPLIGYSNRLSGRPGDTIEFKVSATGLDSYEARLVRVVSADPNPDGPGIIEHEVAADFAGTYNGRSQPFFPGSYARVKETGPLNGCMKFTIVATVWPTTPAAGEQGIVARYDPDSGAGFALAVGADGAATARVDGETVSAGRPLKERTWYRVWASYDARSGILSAGQRPLDPLRDQSSSASRSIDGGPITANADLLIAALGGDPVRGHFNGKIEGPMIFSRALSPEEVEGAVHGADVPGLMARWDFARNMSTTAVADVGPAGFDGTLVNFPARAMTGSTWNAREMCWRHAPEDYAAIHFHDDDIYDFGWQTDFAFTIPDDLASGVYAVRLTAGAHWDTMPVFVCPPRGKRGADLAVLASTFTYAIYGNHGRPDFSPTWRARWEAWSAYPHNPAEHPEYGLSTYNYHGDGSGICHASHLRPLLNLRNGFLTFGEGVGSGLRHFQADSHLTAWLEAKGYGYDVVTDQELHDEGAAAIAGYAAVTTGSHPEYHTAETLDALTGYRDDGGRLMYLGGNGFYWRIAIHPEAPGVLEIRRGETGIRAWAAEPGEYYNAFDGAYGGVWRRSGRPPQQLVGVGFSAQGLFDASYYRKTEAANDPGVSWIFAGIEEDVLGDFGLSAGGAAGYELDRADLRLGTPENAVVVARSENHGPSFVLVPEEHLTHTVTWPGEPLEDLIRADMTYFETPSGGAVFSTGSITFCGSLPTNDCDNNISRLLGNVLDRFLAGDEAG